VAIPWRWTFSRALAFDHVSQFWRDMGLPVVTGSPDDGPFNRSQARNRAVSGVFSEVVIVADADAVPEIEAVEKALDGLGGDVVWLYDEYRIIDSGWVFRDDVREAPRVTCFCGQMLPNCCGAVSGLFACRTETYWRLGGHDERFGGRWGGEDVAFAHAAATLAGARRVPGLAVAFDHAAQRDIGAISPLAEIYETAAGDIETMEWLVADPGRGHPATDVAQWKQRWPSPPPGVVWPPRPEGVTWL
jgi:hypothetical protein